MRRLRPRPRCSHPNVLLLGALGLLLCGCLTAEPYEEASLAERLVPLDKVYKPFTIFARQASRSEVEVDSGEEDLESTNTWDRRGNSASVEFSGGIGFALLYFPVHLLGWPVVEMVELFGGESPWPHWWLP